MFYFCVRSFQIHERIYGINVFDVF